MRARAGIVALAALAALAAGCGGGHHARARTRPRSSGPYRWLVPVSGPQPTIAAENAHPGTTTWRLPGPPSEVGGLAHGDASGYVSSQAVSPGDVERIYVSAPGAGFVRIRVFRMGWYGGTGGREVLVSRRLRLAPQPPCTHRFATGLTECDWHPTLSFAVPEALPSGVYIAKLSASNGSETDCLFVVRAARPQPLLAQLPTSTYEAYNAWGGDSLYPGGTDRVGVTGTTQGIDVSYDRPYDSVTGAGQFFARDVAMVRFLERYGYPVSYTTSESVDVDPGQALGHRALIDFGHSEYWSQRQADAFTRARDSGVSLLFFSSDTLAWRVRYAPASTASSEAGRPGHAIVAYKEHASLDPRRSAPTGPFPGGGASLTGSAYLGCIAPRVQRPGPPTYRYYPWSPSPGLQPSWLFAGTGLGSSSGAAPGSAAPAPGAPAPAAHVPGIIGYEVDMTAPGTPAGTTVVGRGSVPCMPVTEPGEPVPGPGQNLAETTLYTARSGALVFSTGTLGWELGLEPVPSASPDAPRAPNPTVVRMTRNVLDRVLR